MKIFGIGLSRTGTQSLTDAMSYLGYSVIHCPTSLEEIEVHDFSCDITVACRFEELDKKYPGSKFIYTHREINSWLKSCENHYKDLDFFYSSLTQEQKEFVLEAERKIYNREFIINKYNYNKDTFRESYYAFYNKVLNYFNFNKQKDILLFDITKHSWKELINFVGVKKPFPWRNKS